MINKLRKLKLIDIMRKMAIFDAIVVVIIAAIFISIALYNGNTDSQSLEQYSSSLNPTIQTIDPSTGKIGTHVVIYGSGFATNNTIVVSGKEILEEVEASEDGTKLEIDLLNFEVPCDPTVDCPLKIIISNENGISNSVIFKLVGQGFELPTDPEMLENLDF